MTTVYMQTEIKKLVAPDIFFSNFTSQTKIINVRNLAMYLPFDISLKIYLQFFFKLWEKIEHALK